MRRAPRRIRVLVIGAVAAALVAMTAPASAAVTRVERRAGPDRYATAVDVSEASFPGGAADVFLTTGESFPDALAAGPLAGLDPAGPILLVTRDAIPTVTAQELDRLQPERIWVVGGSAAVSDAVAADARRHLGDPNGTVTRVAGDDRFGTAAEVSRYFDVGPPVAYVATGAAFADALPGGAAGAALGGPILLVQRDAIPPATSAALDELDPHDIVVLGGTAAVSDAVVRQLQSATTGTVTRDAGSDRYATSVAVSQDTYQSAATVYLASGTGFPDALAGGPAAGVGGAPLLLVTRDCVPPAVRAEIDRLGATTAVILGGTSAVGASVETLTPCEGSATAKV